MLRGFDAHAIDELAGVHVGFAKADAGEVAGAYSHALGEAVDGEVFAEVFEHPDLELAEGLRGDGLVGEHVAVLGLASGADEEHDELAGDGEGCSVAVVFFDESEGEVDAGGDAGGGVDAAIAEIDGVGLDVDGGEFAGEAVAEVPVGDGLAAVEEAGGGEREGSGADGGDAAGAGGGGGDPRDVGGVVGAGFGAGAAGDEEGVDLAGDFGEWNGVGEGEASVGLEEVSGVGCGDGDVVVGGVGEDGVGEDLEGAGDVEDLHGWRAGDDDLSHEFQGTTSAKAKYGGLDGYRNMNRFAATGSCGCNPLRNGR